MSAEGQSFPLLLQTAMLKLLRLPRFTPDIGREFPLSRAQAHGAMLKAPIRFIAS